MKVAIAGYGQEGEANYKYWLAQGHEVVIFDEKTPAKPLPSEAVNQIGVDAFSKLDGFDLVVRTASLNPKKITADGKIWSASNEFYAKCPAPIVGVTGTKGKGTTCSLIAEMLKAAGKTVHLVGNIGVAALEELPEIGSDDIVVFELSSFQLWDLEKSPQTAVVLMVEPDHQDIHASMAEYVEAKGQIAKHQQHDDLLIYHPTNKYSAEIASQSPAQKKRYLTPEGAYIKNQQIVIEENVICGTTEVGLIGQHNLENICAAVTAAWNYTKDTDAIKQAIVSFKGLPHRLEWVREHNGVNYYNDSFSATPGATIAAIRSFSEPEVLICGGFDRGISFNELASALVAQTNLKKVLLIGQTRHKIAEALANVHFSNYIVIDETDFTKIVTMASKASQPGDVILLSPGCPSFDMFKNFYNRGEQFKQIVGELS